jgi:hypothetical protein
MRRFEPKEHKAVYRTTSFISSPVSVAVIVLSSYPLERTSGSALDHPCDGSRRVGCASIRHITGCGEFVGDLPQ